MSAPATTPSKQIPALREKNMGNKCRHKPSIPTRSVSDAFTRRFLWMILCSYSPEKCANGNYKHLSGNKSALHYKENHVKHKKHNHLLFTTLNCPYNTKIIIIIFFKKCWSVTWINSYIQNCLLINHSDLNCVLKRLISFWLCITTIISLSGNLFLISLRQSLLLLNKAKTTPAAV